MIKLRFSNEIPSEILIEIFEFLNGCELLKCVSCVCTEWHQVISKKLDWKLLVSRRLGFTLIVVIPPVVLNSHPHEMQTQCCSNNEFWKLYFIENVAKHKYQPVLNFLKQHPNITWEQVFEDGKIGDRNNISKFMTFNVSGGESNDDNDNNMAIGESKIGGYPDLPRHFEWPKDSHGKEWPFICQLNVQQLEYLDLTNRVIPKGGGMLYFFTPFDEASSGGSYWGVRKCDHQPMTYLNAIQIKEMGGLDLF
ncbi:hypothetical protein C9374_000681 [Naegleria lovaniensis]|uniref:F-box domain-containing protein n=1 Tax=Naegleria lovaniensis TaxID=51637 RepID=A0AA88GWU6_NAELO|nr:uncharacterized protein C9374_000681 [Naegleria lovaniensis]KAG2388517.1 hypothetical protein C9374_000681 [Naegleria lovaniensis]